MDASLVRVSWQVRFSSAGRLGLDGVDVWTLNPLLFFCAVVNLQRPTAEHCAPVLGLFSASMMDDGGRQRGQGQAHWR